MREIVLSLLTIGSLAACAPDSTSARQQRIEACGLDSDPTVNNDVDVRACDPGDTKKTTICHIPPGNPANMHTICVGNAAVQAHVKNHNDPIGPCVAEPPCDGEDPPGGGDGSGGDGSGGDGSGGDGSGGDGSGGDGSGSGSGSGSDSGDPVLM